MSAPWRKRGSDVAPERAPQRARGAAAAPLPLPPAPSKLFTGMRFSLHNLRAWEVLRDVIRRKGGVVVERGRAGVAPPTHVVCEPDCRFANADAARIAAGAPHAHLLARDWVSTSVARNALQDEAAYTLQPPAEPAAAAARASPPRRDAAAYSDDEGGAADEGAALRGAAPPPPPFVPPPPSGETCGDCGEALTWRELARCQACLASASATTRALHLRYKLEHPNKALVKALSELAEYEELFGRDEERRSAKAFMRAAAVLKATPADVNSKEELDAANVPFVGDKLARVYLKQFWEKGRLERLEGHLRCPERVAARALARLPYVTTKQALGWAQAGLRTPGAVWAAHGRGALTPPLSNDWQKLALEHADALLADIDAAGRAPLVAAVRAAAAAVSAADAPLQVALTGGASRGKPSSHDLDFLVTHPVEGAQAGKLEAMLRALHASPETEQMLVGLAFDESALATGRAKPPKAQRGAWAAEHLRLWDVADAESAEEAGAERPHANKAFVLLKLRGQPLRHVDILVVPRHQYAFWLLGWTGSREFERLLRQHVKQECGTPPLKLSNTALSTQDDTQLVALDGGRVASSAAAADYVAAERFPKTEQDVFRMLRLPWRPPLDRNA